MLGLPTISCLLIAVAGSMRIAAGQLVRPIFLTAPLTLAQPPLGRPDSGLPCFMLAARPALTTSAAFGAFPTLAVLVALATFAALTFAMCPVQFPLPVLTSGAQTSPILILVPS